jgi:hypothetical protein
MVAPCEHVCSTDMYICVLDIKVGLLDTGSVKAKAQHMEDYAFATGRALKEQAYGQS